jgi:acetyl-CoA carboxylase carboxyltransferase component
MSAGPADSYRQMVTQTSEPPATAAAAVRLGGAIRRLSRAVPGSDAPDDLLDQAAALVEQLADRLEPHAQASRYGQAERLGGPAGNFLNHPIVGPTNPCAPPVRVRPDGDRMVGVVVYGLTMRVTDPPKQPMRPLDAYTQKVIQARQRGAVYPYDLLSILTRPRDTSPGNGSWGTFTEYDLDDDGRLVVVDRPAGGNQAGIVVGVLRSSTTRYPEGMVRVALLGDPTKALGSIAEPECRRILAALDLADELGAPVEWFALSAGAKVAMDSGTENMDWVAGVLRRLIEFTQAGGEVNVVVAGINVGAQPYWNAEATMLMHTKGILVMTPDSAMVLTGKQALEYSGGVSAEDNVGIGGYERIMGPNGQAQYWAPDLAAACDILLAHYEYSYVAPGERFPRRAATSDPADRDVTSEPHPMPGSELRRIGDIFSEVTNPGRKQPFDIRILMRATLDRDHPPLERWPDMREAGTVVVFDGHLGGYPVTLLGIESRPLPRFGPVPADGPDQWTAGTLFPLSSKKMARAINSASGSRPVVILANLSGFDGSPESLRRLQLEYGAEIGRAVVNFDGPIVFCVVSRYHGGAFVVFSAALNDSMEVAAVEGSHASVIGGAPAAAVVFAGEVNARTRRDPRVRDLQARVDAATGGEHAQLGNQLAQLQEAVRLEKLGEVAAEFDSIHTVERAKRVGSVHEIIPATRLRPYLIDAVERGMRRTTGGWG